MTEQNLDQFFQAVNSFLIDTFGYTFLTILPTLFLLVICVAIIVMLAFLYFLDRRNERFKEQNRRFVEAQQKDNQKVNLNQDTRHKITLLRVHARETTDKRMRRALEHQIVLLQHTIEMGYPGEIDQIPENVRLGLCHPQIPVDDEGNPLQH